MISRWSQCVTAIINLRVIDVGILISLTLFVYRGLVISEVNLAGDWPYFFDSYSLDYLSRPYSWLHLYMGGYTLYDLYRFPIRLAQATLTYFFQTDYSWTARFLYSFPFLFIGPISMYYLTYVLFKKRIVCFIASSFYMLNDFIIWRVVIGNILMLVSYALIPFILLSFVKSLRKNDFRYGIISGLALGISMFYDLRISLLSFGVVLSYFLYDIFTNTPQERAVRHIMKLSKRLFYLFIPIGVCFVLHYFWIFPAIFVRHESPITASGYDQPYWVDILSYSTLTQTLTMTHWYWLHDLGKNWANSYWSLFWPITAIMTTLVFLPILLKPKDSRITYLSIMAVISIFLSKGSNPPFGEVYMWLFLNFPGFNAFREPLKLMFVTPLFLSLLYGTAIDEIIERLRSVSSEVLSRILRRTILIGAILILLVILSPIIYGQVGLLRSERVPEEYSRINDWVQAQSECRIFWLPYLPSYVTMDQKHPALAPAFFSLFGSYSPSVPFQESFFDNDTKNMAKILGLVNVKYVLVYPESEPNWIYFPNGSLPYKQVLNRQLGLERIYIDDRVSVYENMFFLPRFYGATHGALIVGNRGALQTLASYVNFSRWALFFAGQLKQDTLELLDDIDVVVFCPERDLNDLTLALVNDSYRINLWEYAKPHGFQSGGAWIRDAWWIYDYPTEIPESRSGWLISAGRPQFKSDSAKMEIDFKASRSGIYDLWLRAGFESNRGLLRVAVDHSEVFEGRFSNPTYKGLKWMKLGSFPMKQGNHIITLSSRDGINSIDEMVVMPSDDIAAFRRDLENRLILKKVVTLTGPKSLPVENSSVEESTIRDAFSDYGNCTSSTWVTFKRENPTSYLLDMKIENRVFVIFSDNFHPLWQMSLQHDRVRPIKAYGGLNSFIVRKSGEISAKVEFLPQSYLDIGVYITIFGTAMIVTCLSLWRILVTRLKRMVQRTYSRSFG